MPPSEKSDQRLDIKVSSRGWSYVLEEHGLNKGDFDVAQSLINDCRRSGRLPLDICAEDDDGKFENLEDIDDETVEERAESIVNSLRYSHKWFTPFSFWEDQPYYLQQLVEKIDLKSLFSGVCGEFHIPIANGGGSSDLNMRADMMRRFKYWEARGKKCVLLYCGDLDPGGLHISQTLRSNLQDLAGAVGWSPDNLIIDRFELNADFVDENGLTWIDNLATSKGEYPLDDPRHPDHRKSYVQDYLHRFGARKVEANALVVRPEAGRALCRSAILRYMSADAPMHYLAVLAPYRERLRREILRRLQELYSGGAP